MGWGVGGHTLAVPLSRAGNHSVAAPISTTVPVMLPVRFPVCRN